MKNSMNSLVNISSNQNKLNIYEKEFPGKTSSSEIIRVTPTSLLWSSFDLVLECIDLIEKPGTGILALMDDEAKLAKGTDLNFFQKVKQIHQRHKFMKFPPLKPNSFGVEHFAGYLLH